MDKLCSSCNCSFPKKVKESITEWQKRKYCSYPCYWEGRKGHEPWNKGKSGEYSLWPNGRIVTEETREKLRQSHQGPRPWRRGVKIPKISREKHYAWKGDGVGYHALHEWVQKELGKPDTCEHCKRSGLTGMSIHWANRSQEYKRDISDWIRLCVSCHRVYDLNFNKQ